MVARRSQPPRAAEDAAGEECQQDRAGQEDHGAVEDQEEDFGLGDGALEPLRNDDDSESRADNEE